MPEHTIKRALVSILLAFVLAGMLVAAALAYAMSQAGYWLEAPGRPPARAEAIIILGGDDGDRSARALALYREGLAPTIVLTGIERGRAAPPASLTWRAEFLAERGVPRSAIRFELTARNSYEEATNILALMRAEGWHGVIVVSDPPHLRRLVWSWDRVFEGSDRHYIPVSSEADWWSPGDWWHDERSGAFVIMECIKLAYYLAKR